MEGKTASRDFFQSIERGYWRGKIAADEIYVTCLLIVLRRLVCIPHGTLDCAEGLRLLQLPPAEGGKEGKAIRISQKSAGR